MFFYSPESKHGLNSSIKRRPICCLTLLPALLILVALTMCAGKGKHRISEEQDDSVSSEADTDDGPHVFWQNDSTAYVSYYCDGSIISERFKAADSFRFSGFCHDTNTQYMITAVRNRPMPDNIENVSRILAISDVHGDYENFVEILIAAAVIDSSLNWIWGDGQLVIAGDVFDRGAAVTECLWLIYRLEREAPVQGGGVQYLLGNHELMVLRGDLRYVNDRYSQGIAKRSGFAYDDLFGAEMELGRWLRTKHTVVRLNRILFVHGGLMPEHLRIFGDFSKINEEVRSGLDYTSIRLYHEEQIMNLYGDIGPLWYRGYTQGLEGRYPPASAAQIDSVLHMCDVDRIVVGHSEQDSLRLYHDGKVVAIDVDVETLGGQRALLWQDGQIYLVTGTGEHILYPGM